VKRPSFRLVALLLTLSGCTSYTSDRYLIASPLPPYEGAVRTFTRGQTLPASFDEIAILQTQLLYDEDPRLVTERIRSDAAAVGCDAILNFRVDIGTRAEKYGPLVWTSASGTCVRVRQASPQ
jgi:hypothetical protein